MKKKLTKNALIQLKLLKRMDVLHKKIHRTLTLWQKRTQAEQEIPDGDPRAARHLAKAYRSLSALSEECVTLNHDTIASMLRDLKNLTPKDVEALCKGIHQDTLDVLEIIFSTKIRVEGTRGCQDEEE